MNECDIEWIPSTYTTYTLTPRPPNNLRGMNGMHACMYVPVVSTSRTSPDHPAPLMTEGMFLLTCPMLLFSFAPSFRQLIIPSGARRVACGVSFVHGGPSRVMRNSRARVLYVVSTHARTLTVDKPLEKKKKTLVRFRRGKIKPKKKKESHLGGSTILSLPVSRVQ